MSAPLRVSLGHTATEFPQWVSEQLVKPINLAIALFIVTLTTVVLNDSQSHLKRLPLVNAPKSMLYNSWNVKTEFLHKSVNILDRARALFPGKPFRMLTSLGPLTVLPPEFGHEIRKSPEVSFSETMQQV
ncbi:uncharacterized protein PgNI_12081 [Pyricularia grisea]|uniref:Uncharacterized protein n=1 Tax=Pyricularia grisea TaxID=148305 RepID=A0A6P8AQW3_PYRGI|nr:uncharacterized protein PgNI_12081 [Pyricularia grisea]TLD04455.1 hypothetical protein PgNI_12081 [Pyricularia grisea]